MNTVFLKHFSPPPVNRREILRYAGVKAADDATNALLDDCLKEAENVFSFSVCYIECPVSFCDGFIDFSFTKTESKNLAKNLASCQQVVLFAATIGIGLDRLVSRYTKISPARALLLNAIGTERIESLCDTFCSSLSEEKEKEGLFTVPRYSPGYGDLPLNFQTEIFSVLDPSRKIGLSLNKSLLMSPSKSVTAIVGLSRCDKKSKADLPCLSCNKENCQYRRII